jgi:hypothetical protein
MLLLMFSRFVVSLSAACNLSNLHSFNLWVDKEPTHSLTTFEVILLHLNTRKSSKTIDLQTYKKKQNPWTNSTSALQILSRRSDSRPKSF